MTERVPFMKVPQARAGSPEGQPGEPRRFWNIRNFAPTGGAPARAEIDVYGEIGTDTDPWSGDKVGISAQTFLDEVRALGPATQAGGELTIRVNSFGGSATDGSAIYSVLSGLACKKVGIVDGAAMSAASVLLMACDEIRMPANAVLMIHDPWTVAGGNAAEMRKCADVLDTLKGALLSCYTAKNKKMSGDEIAAAMASETYYTGAEAVEAGFCDALVEPLSAKNLARIDLSGLKKVPQAFASAVEAAKAQVAAEEAEAARVAAEAEERRKAEEAATAAQASALTALQATVAQLAETVAALAKGGVQATSAEVVVKPAQASGDEAALAKIKAFAEREGGEVLKVFQKFESGPIEALRAAVYGKAAAIDAAPIQNAAPGTKPETKAEPVREIGRPQVEGYYDLLNKR